MAAGGVGHEVDEDDVLSRADANRGLLWEVPSGPGALLREHQCRQFVSGETVPLGEARDLLALGAPAPGWGGAVCPSPDIFLTFTSGPAPPASPRPWCGTRALGGSNNEAICHGRGHRLARGRVPRPCAAGPSRIQQVLTTLGKQGDYTRRTS